MFRYIAVLAIGALGGSLTVMLAMNAMTDRNSALPQGAIVAFAGNCPQGWQDFDVAAGRMLIGAGQGEGLPKRRQGEIGGGSENAEVNLSIPQSQNYSSDPAIINPLPESSNQEIAVRGPSMPPFLVVRYCEWRRNRMN